MAARSQQVFLLHGYLKVEHFLTLLSSNARNFLINVCSFFLIVGKLWVLLSSKQRAEAAVVLSLTHWRFTPEACVDSLHIEMQVVAVSYRQSRCTQLTCSAAVRSYLRCRNSDIRQWSPGSETGDRFAGTIPDIWREQIMSTKTRNNVNPL